MGKKRKAEWKPATIPQDFKTEDIAGLLGLEQLDDYNVNDNVINLSDFKTTKKRTKSHMGKPLKKIKKSEERSIKVNGQIVTTKRVNKQAKKKNKDFSNCNRSHLEKGHLQLSVDKIEKGDTSKVNIECVSQNASYLNKQAESGTNMLVGMEAWNSYNLSPVILQALSQLGFKKPTEIQERTLHASISGRSDILGAAETGSGKTLAFGIPIIHGILQHKKSLAFKESSRNVKLSDKSDKSSNEEEQVLNETNISEDKKGNLSIVESRKNASKLYALVLTPTRELAIQVKNHLYAITKFAGIKVAVIVGGLSSQKQERLLKGGPEIVVATPGRLWEMIQKGCEHLQQVDDISFLAIDETDRMLEKGHFEELQTLLQLINTDNKKKRKRQNFVFSATLTMVHDAPKYIVSRKKNSFLITPGQKLQEIITALGVTHPKIIDITDDKGTASTLLEARIVCKLSEKDIYVYYFILRHPGRTLVFCNSIACVRRLNNILDILQCKPYPLHAEMQQRQRLKNLERFRDNANGLLLATDVAARGLDIPDVQHVIHFQVPRTVECYVHRSGRTARVKKEGLTVLIMEPKEVSGYIKLCSTLGRVEDLPEFPVERSMFAAAEARVSLALQIDKLENAMRKEDSCWNWFQKAADAVDLVVDEEEFRQGYDEEERASMRKRVKGLRKQLQNLLNQRMLPKTFSMKYPDFNQIKLDGTAEAIETLKNRKKSHSLNLHISKNS